MGPVPEGNRVRMERDTPHQRLLLFALSDIEIAFYRREVEELTTIHRVARNRGALRCQVNADLVHAAGDGPAGNQRMHTVNRDCIQNRSGLLPVALNAHDSVAGLLKRPVDHRFAEIMDAVAYGPVYLFDSPVLKLEAKVPVRFWISGQDQHAGRLLVEPVAHLRLRMICARQVEEIVRVGAILERRQPRRFVDDHIIVVLVEEDITKSDSVFQCCDEPLPDFRSMTSLLRGNLKLNTEPSPGALTTEGRV